MKTKAYIYIISAGLLWGLSCVFIHFLTPFGFTSFQLTAVRATVAVVCLSSIALIKDRSLFRVNLKQLALLFVVGISLCLAASLYYISIQMTSPSTAVMLLFTSPIFVEIYSTVFLKEKMTLPKFLATAAVLVGCCLISGIIGDIKFYTVGIIIGLLSGLTYAIYHITARMAAEKSIPTMTTTIYAFGFAALLALILGEPWKIVTNACAEPFKTVPLLLGLAIFTFVIPYFLHALAVKDIPASAVSTLGTMEPLSATLYSVMFLGEEMDALAIVGAILILSATVTIALTDKKEKQNNIKFS